VLVEQHQAAFGLAGAGKKHAPDLGETEQAVKGVDGFQNLLIPFGKTHSRGMGTPPILW